MSTLVIPTSPNSPLMGDMVIRDQLKGTLGWWSETERKTDGCLP